MNCKALRASLARHNKPLQPTGGAMTHRVESGAELDLFWQAKGRHWGVELKYGDAPKLTKSMQSAASDLQLSHLWVIYPGEKTYPLTPKFTATPLNTILDAQIPLSRNFG